MHRVKTCPECNYYIQDPEDMSSEELLKLVLNASGYVTCPKCNTSIYVSRTYAVRYVATLLDAIRRPQKKLTFFEAFKIVFKRS